MLIYHFVVIVKWLTIIPEKPSTAMIWVVQTLLIFHFRLNVFCDQINWLHMDVGLSCQLYYDADFENYQVQLSPETAIFGSLTKIPFESR